MHPAWKHHPGGTDHSSVINEKMLLLQQGQLGESRVTEEMVEAERDRRNAVLGQRPGEPVGFGRLVRDIVGLGLAAVAAGLAAIFALIFAGLLIMWTLKLMLGG